MTSTSTTPAVRPAGPPRVGLLTDVRSRGEDEDRVPLAAALRAAGVEPVGLAWDDEDEVQAVTAAGLDLVVVRSPWSYHEHAEEYLAFVEALDATVAVQNPPAMLRWNVDKRYLEDLDAAGVAVVPTRFVAPGDELADALDGLALDPAGQFVVKPTVSAGSKNTARYRADQRDVAGELVAALHRMGKTAMVQPYLDRVDDDGETALVYLDGRFSHGLRKGPLLQLDAALVAGTFALEEMSGRAPDPAQRTLADRIIEVVTARFGTAPLYARVDLLDDGTGRPVLLEVELNEPSLFHLHAPGSAERFAAAIVARLPAALRPSPPR